MDTVIKWADSDEITAYEDKLRDFRHNILSEEQFTAIRLQHGIYGQRQENTQMVRIKVPGGRLSGAQVKSIAFVLEKYAQVPYANITTRQDIQLHFVALDDTPQLMQELAKVNLTTREACGNTVRNITACALAGVCPHEHTDVNPYLQQVGQHFLRHPLTQHLPRKFKMSFSGCEVDCAQALIHDLAVIAVQENGQAGFKILAGGGLGHKPHEAIVVESLVPESQLIPCIEAIISLHHRYSDRKRRAKSRIKFLVDKFGEEGFIEKYKEELKRLLPAYSGTDHYKGEWHQPAMGQNKLTNIPRSIVKQKQAGLFALPVSVPLGDVSCLQLLAIADVMDSEAIKEIRITQDQNIILVDVPTLRVTPVYQLLKKAGLQRPTQGDDVVACPGTWTCRLGITSSREMAKRLEAGSADLKIKVSGCHNGCAQPYVGDIGLHGEGRRIHGKLIPHYQLHFGGSGQYGRHFAFEGPQIPVMRAEAAVARVVNAFQLDARKPETFSIWAQYKGKAYFDELLMDLATVNKQDVTDLSRDLGENNEFKVLQLGGGECAGVAQETVAAFLAEARYESNYRDVFLRQDMLAESLACMENMLRLAAKSLLSSAGERTFTDDVGNLDKLKTHYQADDQFISSYEHILEIIQVLKLEPAKESLLQCFNTADKWMKMAIAMVDKIKQNQSERQAVKPGRKQAQAPVLQNKIKEHNDVIDVSGELCQIQFLKAKFELNQLNDESIVKIKVDSGQIALNVSKSLNISGYPVIGQSEEDQGKTILRVLNAQAKDRLVLKEEAI